MNKETGGPAFPSTHHNGWGEPEKGMTLRDYFAAKALQGMLAGALTPDSIWSQDQVSDTAYAWADSMLKAREQ